MLGFPVHTSSAARNFGQAVGHFGVRANNALHNAGTTAGLVFRGLFGD